MKKRFLIVAGLVALTAFSGCGKDDGEPQQQAEVTIVPSEAPDESTDLVDMQVSTEETIENVIGTKTSTSSEVTIVNETGGEIVGLYVRPNTDDMDDYEWGDELIKGSFSLKDGDKALYYFEKDARDSEGNPVSRYDIRIIYAEEDRNECYFRDLPLTSISQISLCMDGEGEDAIPYARYYDVSGKTEHSTLQEVKERLGLSGTEDSSDESSDGETQDGQDDEKPQPTEAPSETTPQPEDPEPTEAPSDESDPIAAARGCIGQSLDALYSAVGSPSGGSEYVNEPESGETGYYYYDTFTVSTSVGEDGSEIVANVW